ncbi:hypothetical protein [Sporosarcina sp. Te-1]|uniref:hypothetical protein n=1 Tax=Sporosarcina sp. Te-1 TaxID=2818390 RepID=UPI001A9F7369|nr:hypothetical protein [Sporosarcina sp. Te-1]QTD41058.1 hypothetical protein J3U78_20405 [Sporosarcina sp. Te-1]
MKRISLFIMTICLVIPLIGYDNNKQASLEGYKDSDIAAIVGDKEITIGELRFLNADQDVLSRIDDAVRVELMIQEAKKMNLDLSDKIDSMKKAVATTSLDDIEMEKSEREFIKSQARKLGMKTDENFKEYLEITSERSLYIMEYTQKAFRELVPFNGEELAVYNEELDEFLDELVNEQQNEIKILIK